MCRLHAPVKRARNLDRRKTSQTTHITDYGLKTAVCELTVNTDNCFKFKLCWERSPKARLCTEPPELKSEKSQNNVVKATGRTRTSFQMTRNLRSTQTASWQQQSIQTPCAMHPDPSLSMPWTTEEFYDIAGKTVSGRTSVISKLCCLTMRR